MGSNLLKRLKRWWLWRDNDKVINSAHTSLSPPTSYRSSRGTCPKHFTYRRRCAGGVSPCGGGPRHQEVLSGFSACGSGGGHRWSDPTADTVVTGTWNIKRRVQSPKNNCSERKWKIFAWFFSLQHYWLAYTGKVSKVREEVKGQIGIIL